MTDSDDDDDDDDDVYRLERVSSRNIKSLSVNEITYKVHVPDKIQGMPMLKALKQVYNMFHHALRNIKRGMGHRDKIRVLIFHPTLHNPVHVKAASPDDLTVETIMTAIEKVLQSNSQLPLDDRLRIAIATLKPMGGGRGVRHHINKHVNIKKKRSVIAIVNPDDNLCLERAIAVCMVKLNQRVNQKKWKKIIRKGTDREDFQYKEAVKLRRSVGIQGGRPSTIHDIKAYEDFLNVQIVVISVTHANSLVYRGSQRRLKKIFLLQDGDHFHSIVSIAGFLGVNHFCHSCLKPIQFATHNCETRCSVCLRDNCIATPGVALVCSDCNQTCRSKECFDQHKSRTSNNGRKLKLSQCEKYWRCPDCCTVLQRSKRQPQQHQCGERMCTSCQRYVVGPHLCYQRSEPAKPANSRYVWLDYETRQDDVYACPQGYSKPPKCANRCPDDAPCKQCAL